MAVNFGILSQAPTIGARFMEGQQAAAAEQERNMLRQMQAEQMAAQRQRQQFDFEQVQEERRRRVEREGQYQKLADLVREHGLDPDDPKVLGQFAQAALMSGQPQLANFVTSMAERAARRREAAGEAARIGAILGPQQPGAAAPAVNALTAPAAPAVNALVAAPAAPPTGDAQKIAELERQRDALEALGTPAALNQAKRLDRQLEKLRPKEVAPSEVVKLSRELAEAQAAGNTALASSLQARIQRLTEKPVGAQTVIKLPEQERAEKGARGKLLVEQYQDVSKAASLAAKTLPAVETQERVLDSGFKTGFGTEVQKAGASVLAALGVPEAAKYATSAQTFLAATQQAVLQRQLEQKGPQTEADAQRITQTGAQLGNTPEANRFIISVAKAQLKRDIAQRNFYDKWWKDKGTYDGAEDAWFSGDGGKSLFDRPELKQYAAPTKATPGSAPAAGVQPYSDAEKERRYQEWKRNQRGAP